jgi:hypothetical protein
LSGSPASVRRTRAGSVCMVRIFLRRPIRILAQVIVLP